MIKEGDFLPEDSPEAKPEENKSKEGLPIQERLSLLVQSITGNPRLKVTTDIDYRTLMEMAKMGKDARETWFMHRERDKKTGEITQFVHIPEEIIGENENTARGKAAHEAGHVVITRAGEIVPETVMKELGFGATLMAIEERPTDQVVRDRYEGAGMWLNEARKTDSIYAQNSDPQIIRSIPRFEQLADLCVYAPHFDEMPPYDPEVIETYEKIKSVVEEVEHILPKADASEEEITQKAIERYNTIYTKIWPEAKELVKRDAEEEKLRKLLEQLLNQGQGGRNVS